MAQTLTCFIFIAIAIHGSYTAPDTGKRIYRDLPIKYPGPAKPVNMDRYSNMALDSDVPEECRNQTYCTVKPRDYPDQAIKEFFKNKRLQLQVPGPELELDLVIGNRQGDPNEEDNCASVVSYEPIYKLKDGNTWQNVVQAPEWAYEQKVRIEKCLNPNSSCFSVGTFPKNIRTMCKQKFATWKLQLMDENKKLVMKEIDLPSCCSCHYEVLN